MRRMTLSDLYNYFENQNKSQTFSCKNENDTIVVQVNGNLNFSKSDALDGLYPTRVQMNFVGDNLNGSRIKMKAQENALPSSKFRPLLALIHDVDGEPQFYGHNFHQDENGEIVYDEKPVGVIAEEAHIEHDDEYDMDYAVANGYIWEEYSKAAYIIERDQKCDVSVELSIRELSYDAKDKILNLDNFYYSGCTILGMDDDGNKVNPAMPGSNIQNSSVKFSDFSIKNDEYVKVDGLVEILEKLNTTLSNFNIQNSKEGGNDMAKLEKKLVDDVNDLDNVVETFSEPENMDVNADPTSDENANETFEDENVKLNESEEKTEDEVIETEEVQEDESKEDEVIEDEEKKKKCKCCEYSVQLGDSDLHQFSVSLNDAVYAISQLVNDTYVDDCTWYSCTVYDNPKEVVMVSWEGKAYKQSYKVKDDVYSLKGDRVEVYNVWMTSDEKKAFEEMKSKYSDISEKLSKYEAEPSKMEILNSEDYRLINESESFAELCKTENHFDMSIDEVRETADKMLNEFAKSCGRNKETTLNFAELNTNTVNKKSLLSEPKKKSSRYGDLF